LRLRLPQLDCLVVQEIGLGGCDDATLLAWAADHDRIHATHDLNTVVRHASNRIRQGSPMAGVIIVPEQIEIGRAIADLEMIVECVAPPEIENQIQYLPL
jgi:hypothetical protein